MLHIKESYYEMYCIIVIKYDISKKTFLKSYKKSELLSYRCSLVYGYSYGVVIMKKLSYNNEYIIYHDCFFRQRDYDKIYNKMNVSFTNAFNNKNDIMLTLQNGDIGLFRLIISDNSLNDKYILKTLSKTNDTYSQEETVSHVFDTIYSEIKLRTAWKKLYFRCFRKSFSPDKVNGIKNIIMNNNVLSNVLNHEYSV